MKTSTIFSVVAGAALAAAQLDKLPTCALTCAIGSISTSGCAQTDIACICKASSFLTGILTCIQAPGGCTPAQVDQTVQAASVLCAQAGVTITPPGGAPSTTSAAPETTTSAVVVPPTTTEETAPTTTAVATSVATEPTSSAVVVPPPTYGTTSSVVTLTTTTTICPSSTTAATYIPPPASNTTVSVPPPSYTGAAGSVAANAGAILIGAAVAMFFA
ncbi:hypothetical protein TWF694_003213 [Orbilia ellipsospora]|uniref:CFEM domain-containing protein n=1 Tax=Orbilia ellipsospora TaxID=2528407 RepID=A0AAV9X0U0_9PEZI